MNANDVIADVKAKMTERKIRRYSEPGGRGVRRPEEILRDVRGLKLRQRVSLVLADEILREELEGTIKNSTVNGVTRADTIRTFQDFLLPSLQPSLVSVGKGYGGPSTTVLPVNDIRGESTLDFSKSERILRCKLAAVYRLVDIMGWSEAIFNHISVGSSPDQQEFLLNPFGLLFSEVTASSLVKCDIQGNIIDGGSTSLGINKAGFILHSTIHEARPDINCVIHIHTPTVVAVASMKCGFLRISQESLVVGEVSYHDYWGILIDEAEKESIKNDLGPTSMVMFLRNHGVVVCGKTIEDTFMLLNKVMTACESQVKAVSIGLDNLNIISDEAYNQVQNIMQTGCKEINKTEDGKQRMTLSEYYFEAYMRWLDSQGYRTGYAYHMPDVFVSGKPSKKIPESRIPPQTTSDRDLPYQVYYDHQKNIERHRSMGRGNTHLNRVKWLNKPVQGTQYIKEEKEKNIPEDDVTNILLNGHVNESEEITEVVQDDTKIITKTMTSVTETKVVLDVSTTDESVIVNGDDKVLDEAPVNGVEESPAKSPASLHPPTEGESTPDSTLEEGEIKSPQKVKKSRSFKKALMKKFKKDEKKEENEKAK